jgi:hypothetical protein
MEKDHDIQELITLMADYLGLTLEDAYREGVALHLRAAREIAAPLLALEPDDHAEAAPVFRA